VGGGLTQLLSNGSVEIEMGVFITYTYMKFSNVAITATYIVGREE
jgi:hypothetical protein